MAGGGVIGEIVVIAGPEKGLGMLLANGQFYVLGSGSGCDLEVSGEDVCPRHARIMVGSGMITVEDLRTEIGTHVNGQKVQVATARFGDYVRVGGCVFRLDERTDAFAPPRETLEIDGRCDECAGPIVMGEFGHPDLYEKSGGKLCAPCAERELIKSGQALLSLPPGISSLEQVAIGYEEEFPEVVGGRYAIVAKVGEGFLGTVYEAWDGRSGERVAVKILHKRFQEDPYSFQRLSDAGRSVMLLEHPWVARPLRIGDDPAGCYLASEFVEGVDLWRRIDSSGPFDVDLAIRLGVALADALDLIHVRGMIHGDLKPSNLLVVGGDRGGASVQNPLPPCGLVPPSQRRHDIRGANVAPSPPLADDRVKITDVWLARACLGTGISVVRENLSPRTLAFHAPEILIEDREADVRSDIYSLGAVLYCLVGGVEPYAGSSPKELARRIVLDAPRPIGELRPGLPDPLARVIARAMDKRPGARFASASELGQALMEAWL